MEPAVKVAVILALVALVGLDAAQAQRVRFAPQIGIYVPTERLYQLASGQTGSQDFQLEAGPSFGARLGFWFGRRFGVELGGNYVPTTFQLSGGATTKQDAKLFTGTGQAVFFLLPPTGILSLFVSGGVAAVSRGGVAFTNADKTTNFGGVVGAGAGINLGGLALTVGADLLAYKADYRGTQPVSAQLSQKDVNLKVGFGIPFGGATARAQPQ